MSGLTELPYSDLNIDVGGRRLVGQTTVREQLAKILSSGRLSHAYLFAGPAGVGKKALALAFAEAVNGLDNLSDLQGRAFSKKSSWSNHPDIRIFLPLPGSDPDFGELSARSELLSEDPYEVVDFNNRPSLTSETASGNRNAFYSISYFRNEIRPSAYLKPNEGYRNIIIISEVERFRTESSNAFLKLLEEPPPNLMFILTTENANALLPTITSRCQIIRCAPLSKDEIQSGLMQRDGVNEQDASFLSRISGGNYSMTRFYDVERLQTSRNEVLQYLRASYSMDAAKIVSYSMSWNKELNTEGQISILNLLEVFIRDLAVYRDTQTADFLTNVDQLTVISKFCESLQNARLDAMQELIDPYRAMLRQSVSPRLVFTVLANRMAYLMRGKDTPLPESETWRHAPAYDFH